MVRRQGRGEAVEQRLEHVRGKVGDFLREVFTSKEETWYACQCCDGSVLSCPSVIVHPLPAGMARLQPRAYRARLWRRDAGGGSPLSSVSGDAPDRHAQAMSCAVCTVLWIQNTWG